MNDRDERETYEELVREWPIPSPANVRRDLLEADIDVSLHATVVAAIEDTTCGGPVTAAAILPVECATAVPTFALGDPGTALRAAVGDDKPRKIVGKMWVGDGGGYLLAVHGIIASDVRLS